MSYFNHLGQAKLITAVFSSNKKRFAPYSVFMADVMKPSQTLDSHLREAIALHVSAINGCHYCIGSHRAVLESLGCEKNYIDLIESGESNDDKVRELLKFARELTVNSEKISAKDLNYLRELGWNDQDIEDTIAITAVFAFMNRLVDGYGIKGDEKAFKLVGNSISQGGYEGISKLLGA